MGGGSLFRRWLWDPEPEWSGKRGKPIKQQLFDQYPCGQLGLSLEEWRMDPGLSHQDRRGRLPTGAVCEWWRARGLSLSLHVCVSLCSGWEDLCGLGRCLSRNADPTVRVCCGRGDTRGTVHRSCAETTVPTGGSTGHCQCFLHYLFLKLLSPFVVCER